MPRNRELMRVFRDIEMVEQLGSGMKRILRTYDETAFSFTDHFMRSTFYFDNNDRINYENGSINYENGSINYENGRINDITNLSDTELLIFAEIRRNPRITVAQLIHDTGVSERTINRALKTLRENGYIVRVGARKNGYWNIIK